MTLAQGYPQCIRYNHAHVEPYTHYVLKNRYRAQKFSNSSDESGIHTRIGSKFAGRFMGDPLRIRQILLNLLGNAVKFTDHGIISLQMTQKATLNGRCAVRIIVTDPGIGMEKAQMKKIFGKYVQGDCGINRQYGGTGLGLFISQELAHLMGGTITVKSQPGKGSQFIVTLPLKKLSALPAAA